MGLRAQAEADLSTTLEAPEGFGDPFTLTDPGGFASATQLYGRTADIGATIDVDTGQPVTGRQATLTARISTLLAAGYSGLPVAVAGATGRPWLVSFAGPSSPAQLYKVKESRPDRALGVVTLILEFWKAAP